MPRSSQAWLRQWVLHHIPCSTCLCRALLPYNRANKTGCLSPQHAQVTQVQRLSPVCKTALFPLPHEAAGTRASVGPYPLPPAPGWQHIQQGNTLLLCLQLQEQTLFLSTAESILQHLGLMLPIKHCHGPSLLALHSLLLLCLRKEHLLGLADWLGGTCCGGDAGGGAEPAMVSPTRRHMSEARAASCSLASHTPSLAKLGPATATALKRYRSAPIFVVVLAPKRSRAIGAVKTEVMLA